MQERYNTTYETARTDLLSLAKLGYLRMHVNGQKYIFLLDKERCLNQACILDKRQTKPSDKRQTKLSELKSEVAHRTSKSYKEKDML